MQDKSTEESIDYKKWVFLVLSHWYLFALFLGIGITSAMLYKRYAINTYAIRTSVLIKTSTSSTNPIAQTYYSTRLAQKSLTNEINIINSITTIRKTVKELDFGVSYFMEGNIKATELYPNSPFIAKYDTVSMQIPFGQTFDLLVLDNNLFRLTVRGDEKNFTNNNYRFGDTIQYNDFKFSLLRRDFDTPLLKDEKFFFKFNNFEELAQSYRYSLGISPLDKESSIIIITTTSTHPPKEIDFLNKLCSVYIVESMEEKNLSDSKAIDFINEQIAVINDTLVNMESNLSQFRKKYNALDMQSESGKIYSKIKQFQDQRDQFELDLKYFDYLKKYLKERGEYEDLIVPASAGMTDPTLQTLLSQLIELQLKKNTEFKTINPNSPFYKDNEAKIQELKRSIYEVINNVEQNHRIFLEDLERKLSQQESNSLSILDSDKKYSRVKRIYDINSSIYNFLLQKKVEASITKAANIPDIKVVDQASITGSIRPNHDNIKMFAIILGLLIPALIVVAKEMLNDNVRYKEDVTRMLKMPFLGVVGHNQSEESVVITKMPKSSISESFRSTRSNLQFFMGSAEKKVVLITSAVSGEGKTFSSINISSVVSISGKKTVLIGADLRKPKLFNEFGLKNDFGLSNYLVGRCKVQDIIQSTEIENLSVITSGPIPPNPSELIMNPRMDKLIAQLREEFDFVLIDSPPIGLVTDAHILMKMTDFNIYVIRNNYSTKTSLKYIAELHATGKLNNMAVLMNDVKPQDRYGYNYGYGYGHGYGYGYGYYAEDAKDGGNKNWLSVIYKLVRGKRS